MILTSRVRSKQLCVDLLMTIKGINGSISFQFSSNLRFAGERRSRNFFFLESDDGPVSQRTRVSQFFRPERFPDRVAGEKDQGGGQPQAPDHREVQTFGSDSNLSKNQQPA